MHEFRYCNYLFKLEKYDTCKWNDCKWTIMLFYPFELDNYLFSKHWSDPNKRMTNQHVLVTVSWKLMLLICGPKTEHEYFWASSDDRNWQKLVSCWELWNHSTSRLFIMSIASTPGILQYPTYISPGFTHVDWDATFTVYLDLTSPKKIISYQALWI